jgi:hypothetical protein
MMVTLSPCRFGPLQYNPVCPHGHLLHNPLARHQPACCFNKMFHIVCDTWQHLGIIHYRRILGHQMLVI